jgi:methionine aminopeptidase
MVIGTFWDETDTYRSTKQAAADIVHAVVKQLVELCVEGAKVIDLCLEGDKLIEKATAAVYNKSVKGVKVNKGPVVSSPIH